MFVLGVDPGLSRCGFGLVEGIDGPVRRGVARLRAVRHGVLSTPPTDALPSRLASMHAQLRSVILEHRPDVVVVERVFFQTNARTAMGVAQASGLALAIAHDAGCEVVQYTSNEVKQSVTGFGGAQKAQVQRMVASMLGLAEIPRPADAADALALALHHLGLAPLTARVRSQVGADPTAGLRVASSVGGSDGASLLGNARVAGSAGGVRLAAGAAGARGSAQPRVAARAHAGKR
jgi:crossover junction endodeoxyribonuclease RuvC